MRHYYLPYCTKDGVTVTLVASLGTVKLKVPLADTLTLTDLLPGWAVAVKLPAL